MSKPTYDELEQLYRETLKHLVHERQRADLLGRRLAAVTAAAPAPATFSVAIRRVADGSLSLVTINQAH